MEEIINLDNANKESLFVKLKNASTSVATISNNSSLSVDKLIPSDVTSDETTMKIISIKDYKILQDLDIISNILKLLNWTINNCDMLNNVDNTTSHISNIYYEAINWICDAFKYFIVELKIPEINNKAYIGLVRSSYKLCPQKSNCIFQYPDDANESSSCKNQHYPYLNLYHDSISIKNYIKNCFDKSTDGTKTSKLISAYTTQTKGYNVGALRICLLQQ